MSTEPHKLTREKASAVAEYIFAHPGQYRQQILEGLGGIVSEIDFYIAQDILEDKKFIHARFVEARPKEGIFWGVCYFPDESTKIDSVKDYLKDVLKN